MNLSYSKAASESPSRKKHVTRLPSSALLGSSLKHSLSSQVRVIQLKPRRSAESVFVNKWRATIGKSVDTVSWDLLKSEDSANHFVIVASLNQSASAGELTPPGSKSSADQGMLNHLSKLETQVSDLISLVSSDLESPAHSSQCRLLVTSGLRFSESKKDVSEHSWACIEQLQVKTGYEVEFTQMITEQMRERVAEDLDSETAPSTPLGEKKQSMNLAADISEETGMAISYLALQDCNDSLKFLIFYSFTNEDDISIVRNSKTWKNWRRRIAPCLSGVPDASVLRRISPELAGAIEETEQTSVKPVAKAPHHPPDFALPQSAEVADRAVLSDSRLEGCRDAVRHRFEAFTEKVTRLESELGDNFVDLLTKGHQEFGVHKLSRNGQAGTLFREYLKNATAVWVRGEFNAWDAESHPMSRVDEALGIWEIFVPESECPIPHLTKYKLVVEAEDGRKLDRVSAWATTAWSQDEEKIIDGIVDLSESTFKHAKPTLTASPVIYEVHMGVATEAEAVGTYIEAEKMVLPRMKAMGFNTLLLIGIQEHAYYPSAGWHVTLPYATSSRFGNETELRQLIDTAHGMGIVVVMSVIHSHVSCSEHDSIATMDGSEESGLFRVGMESRQRQWDGKIYDYSNTMTLKYLLSNLRFWMDRFNFDGFRFEGVSSILYKDHAVNAGFDRYNYQAYFNHNMDFDGQVYLMLANEFIHRLNPKSLTIANDHVGSPTLATSVTDGGVGFDYTMSQHLTESLGNYLERADGYDWSLNALRYDVDRLSSEKRLAFIESFESTVVSKRPMKIAFFAWETLHTIAVGGIAPHVTELAAALRRVGHEVHIFTRATGASNIFSVQYGVYYHEVTFNLDRDFVQECANMCGSFVHAMLQWEKAEAMTFDLIHGHDWLVARAVTALKGLGRTCVFTMHSTEAGRCGNKVFGGESQRIRNIEKDACHQADRVICVSGVLAEEVKTYYSVPGDKIRVVYNGCNVQNFDGFEDAAPIKERYGVQPLEPTILFVGRFVVQKGVDLLVEAAPAVLKFRSDLKFVIVGDGHMRADVEARAAALGIAHAFRFVGSKTGAELKSLFKMCDAVIIPSRNEPFGIVVLEAWSAYKPVIATTCGGPRDFVTPNVDGFLVDPEPNSIAWGCCEALKNFEHTRWMGERGRVKAAYSFSWDTIGQQTRDIYYELTNKADCTYGLHTRGNCALSQRIIGGGVYDHMTVFDNDGWVARGLCLMRMMQLLVSTLGGEAWMSLMGSEFAHPDWIDFPRPGNNFSSAYARRQMSLACRTDLKYKHYNLFTAAMLEMLKQFEIFESSNTYVTKCDEDNKILAYERGECLFIFNLSPDRSHESYGVGHSLSSSKSGNLRLLLNSDEQRFGGWNRLKRDIVYGPCEPIDERAFGVQLYVPARCALVLTTEERYSSLPLEKSRFLLNDDPDVLCAQLAERCS